MDIRGGESEFIGQHHNAWRTEKYDGYLPGSDDAGQTVTISYDCVSERGFGEDYSAGI